MSNMNLKHNQTQSNTIKHNQTQSNTIKPLVSILSSCYNAEYYLQRYLDSILAQTYQNIELVLVNDGSTDKTEDIIQSNISAFESKGIKLRYVYTDDLGVGGAFNVGLKYITGEYFTWCDPDDYFHPLYIETKVNFFQNNPEYSLVRCNGYCVSEDDITHINREMVTDEIDKQSKNPFYNFINNKHCHWSGSMVRTSDFNAVVPEREIYVSRHGQNAQLLFPMTYYYQSAFIDEHLIYIVERSDSHSRSFQNFSLEQKIERIDGWVDIKINTVRRLNMPENERESAIKILIVNSIRDKMMACLSCNDKSVMKNQYHDLKKYTSPSIRDVIIYIISRNNAILYCCRKMWGLAINIKRALSKL